MHHILTSDRYQQDDYRNDTATDLNWDDHAADYVSKITANYQKYETKSILLSI
jgi:hypothetical protein